MRIMLFLVGFCVLLVTGCVTSTRKLSELSLGMTKPQVIQVLGEPHSVSAHPDGSELLRFQLSGRDAPLLNPNAKRFADGYTVQLFQGKVVAFGRDDEFRAIRIKTE
jgi:predicted component of type VI protein secretion system